MNSLSVVIPCLNEELAVDAVLSRLHEKLQTLQRENVIHSWEVIVIDDGSSDSSAALLRRYDWVKLINHDKSQGYGKSLMAGFSQAQSHLITFFDMDFSYDSQDLGLLLDKLKTENLDLVFGNRLHGKNGMPKIRRLGNMFYAWVVRLLYERSTTDVCTGFRLFRRDILPMFQHIRYHRLNFTTDFTTLLLKSDLRIGEVNIQYHDRKGESKLSIFFDGFEFLKPILANRFRTVKLR